MANYNSYLIDKNGNSVFYRDKPDLSKGDLYISVSQVLSMLGGNDFLIKWALMTFGTHVDPLKAHAEYMEKVSDLGSRLHKYIEYDLKKTEYPENELADDMFPGILSWDKFKSEHDIEMIDSERVLHSKKYRFAGTLDLRVKIDGKIYIADLKTGSVQDKAFIQLMAYKTMMQEMGLSDGTEGLLVLGGGDSKTKIADGGRMFMHTLEDKFNGRVSEQDLFVRLMCLRELWFQENIKSRKWAPIIKGMQEYIDPIIQDFKEQFNSNNNKLKENK